MSGRGGDRRGLRWGLTAVLTFDVFFLGWHHFLEPPMPEQMPYWPWFFVWLHHQPALLIGLSLIALAALGTFALGRRPITAGIVALLSIGLINEAYSAVVDSPRRMFFSAGATLAGWLLGLVVARAQRTSSDRAERLAEMGAMGALAATYVSAGMQKVLNGALFKSTSLRAHIFTHHEVNDSSLLGQFAHAVATEPWLSALLSFSVVVIQGGAFLWLAGPRMRVVWGTLLMSFHLGTLVLLHIIYVEATALLILFTYPWHSLRPRVPAEPIQRIDRTVAVRAGQIAAVVVAIAWVIPTPHELDRPRPAGYGEADALLPEQGGPDPRANSARPVDDARVRSIGPIALGDELGGWKVVHLRRESDEIVVALEKGEAGVRFAFRELREGDFPSPFDRENLRVYVHRTELDETEYEAAGRSLSARLLDEITGDPSRLVDWLADDEGQAN